MAHSSFIDLAAEIKLAIFGYVSAARPRTLKSLRLTNRAIDQLEKPLLFRLRYLYLDRGFEHTSIEHEESLLAPEAVSIMPYIREAVVAYGHERPENTQDFHSLLRAIPYGLLDALRIHSIGTFDPRNVDQSCLEALFQSQPNMKHLELQIQCDWSNSRIIPLALKSMELWSLFLEYGTEWDEEPPLDAYQPTLNCFRQMLNWTPTLVELKINASQGAHDGFNVADTLFRGSQPRFAHTLRKLQLFGIHFGEDCSGVFDAFDFSRLSALSVWNCQGTSHLMKGLNLNYTTLAIHHFALDYDRFYHEEPPNPSDHAAIMYHLCAVLSKITELRTLYSSVTGGTVLLPVSTITQHKQLRKLILPNSGDMHRLPGQPQCPKYDTSEFALIKNVCSRLIEVQLTVALPNGDVQHINTRPFDPYKQDMDWEDYDFRDSDYPKLPDEVNLSRRLPDN